MISYNGLIKNLRSVHDYQDKKVMEKISNESKKILHMRLKQISTQERKNMRLEFTALLFCKMLGL